MPNATLLLYPEALASSVTLPAEILHAAAQMARATRGRSRAVPSLYDANVRLVGATDAAQITLDSGLRLSLDGHFDTRTACDLLILPAIWRHPHRVVERLRSLLPKFTALHHAGTTICSVGTASNLLAEAGLLDHRPATTHWHDFDRFAAQYPNVELKRRHLITQSDRLYCVGSVNSIGDFMVHKVEEWYGDRVARAVEAQFSPEARQPFADAAFLQSSPSAHHDALIRELQDYLQQFPERGHSLNDLARRAGLSSRTLNRRFQRATGQTPTRYIQGLRLREAKALLQHSDLTIAEIAWQCGFGSPSRFAQVFRERHAMSARSYRSAVRGKRFAGLDQSNDNSLRSVLPT